MNNNATTAGKGRCSSFSSSSQSCSICSFKSYIASSNSSEPSRSINSSKKTSPFLHPSAAAGMGMLDASFVNIHSPTDANHSNNKNDIDSILNEALTHNCTGRGGDASSGKGSLQEASIKMAAYAEAAMELIQEAESIDDNSSEKDKRGEKYYCNVCIDR